MKKIERRVRKSILDLEGALIEFPEKSIMLEHALKLRRSQLRWAIAGIFNIDNQLWSLDPEGIDIREMIRNGTY